MTTKTERQIKTLTQLANNYRRLAADATDETKATKFAQRADRYENMAADVSTYRPLRNDEM